MTKTKYTILTTTAILPLIALAPFLQLQRVNAQTDNSDNGDNSGSLGYHAGYDATWLELSSENDR
jgi:hypothetical protein